MCFSALSKMSGKSFFWNALAQIAQIPAAQSHIEQNLLD